VLVTEDDDRVRQFAIDALRELGYSVLHASGGARAIEMLGVRPDISLLLTDVVMPDMNGAQLAERARQLNPNLKVLSMTGYTRNAIVHNGTLDPGIQLLSKPFTIDQLARKVRSVIDTAAASVGS
jgi:CheY-like chemotaxis protein